MQLERLQLASEILRRVIRFLQLSRRLSLQTQGQGMDLTKAAQTLNEIDDLLLEADLTGIEVIEAEKPRVAASRQFVIQQADESLSRALSSSNQAEIAAGLQVFFNIDQLPQKVRDLLAGMNKFLAQEIRKTLDNKTLAQEVEDKIELAGKGTLGGIRRVGEPSAGMTAAWLAALWLRLEKLMDVLFDNCQKIYLLELVLSKKRDPVTHVLFMDEALRGLEGGLVPMFWTHLTESLEREFSNATKCRISLLVTPLPPSRFSPRPPSLASFHFPPDHVSDRLSEASAPVSYLLLSGVVAGNCAGLGGPPGQRVAGPQEGSDSYRERLSSALPEQDVRPHKHELLRRGEAALTKCGRKHPADLCQRAGGGLF